MPTPHRQPARKRLPVKPSAEHLRKQAKRLSRAAGIDLASAQYQLARDYGARDWAELMHMIETMVRGASEDAPRNSFEELPAAANAGDLARVRAVLESGRFTQHDLDLALARAVLRFAEREEIARMVLEHGADPDGQYGAGYGPIVFVTGECLDVGGLRFLIDAGADVTFAPIDTKYGKHCPVSYWMGSYLRGRVADKRAGIDLLLAHGAHVPAEVTPEVLAIHRNDGDGLTRILDRDPSLVGRMFAVLLYTECPGGTLLHAACEFGASACIRVLVERGADVNRMSDSGLTPLHCAMHGCDAPTIEYLLDHGAAHWIEDRFGRTPVHHLTDAAINPHRDAVERVMVRVNYGSAEFREAVEAIDAGEVERLARILRDHPDLVHRRAPGGDAITRGYFSKPTLLHFVACNPNRGDHVPPRIVESTRVILDAGAVVDARTDHAMGGTTLALVASSGPAHADGMVAPILDLLVERGADPTEGLSAALLHRFTDTARHLIRLGARHTVVSSAALGEHTHLRRLVHDATEEERLRAAWAAAINGEAKSLEVLIDAGVDVNARLPRPFTPTMMHEAAWNGHRGAVEVLLARGADRTVRDTQYHGTPSDWAAHNGHPELAELCRPPG